MRLATLEDVDVVTELRLALLHVEERVNPFYAALHPRSRQRARAVVRAQLRSPDEVTFLADRGGEVVGVLRCAESRGSPLVRQSRYASITAVYVHADQRRRGVLRALLRGARRWCLDRGIRELRLHCAVENQDGNAAWQALGFEVVEVRRRLVLTDDRGS